MVKTRYVYLHGGISLAVALCLRRAEWSPRWLRSAFIWEEESLSTGRCAKLSRRAEFLRETPIFAAHRYPAPLKSYVWPITSYSFLKTSAETVKDTATSFYQQREINSILNSGVELWYLLCVFTQLKTGLFFS